MPNNTNGNRKLVVRLGWVCLVAGVLGVLGAINAAVTQPAVDESRFSYPFERVTFVFWAAFFVLQHLALLAGLYGFARSEATGTSRMGRLGAWGAVVAMGVLAATELLSISAADLATSDAPVAIDVLYGLGSLLIGVGLVLAGVATIRAGRWQGWERFIPVVLGASLFVPVAPALLLTSGPTDPIGRIAIAAWMAGFALLGWALVKNGRAPVAH